MKPYNRTSRKSDQHGIAMVVALLLLLIITVMGLVSLRSSMMSNKITTSARASTITFQAAESALAALFREAQEPNADVNPANFVNALVSQLAIGAILPIDRCARHGELITRRACAPGDVFDGRGLVQASSTVVIRPDPQLVQVTGANEGGSQVSRSGGSGTLFADYEYVAVGRGELEAFDMTSHNVQEFAKIGVVPGDDL